MRTFGGFLLILMLPVIFVLCAMLDAGNLIRRAMRPNQDQG